MKASLVKKLGANKIAELEGPFCGEEKEKDLEVYSVVHFLDSLEGEK